MLAAWLLWICVGLIALFAITPAVVYAGNVRRYRPPRLRGGDEVLGREPDGRPRVSVLIPARDEEASIGEAVASVLAETEVPIELIVLDDHSADATAEIVADFAATDPRVRLETSDPLPDGWCGKQFACWQLASLAAADRLLFLDADVRVEPHAIARTLALFDRLETERGVGLLSGVPRQIVGTVPEAVFIPLIHLILLCYLPIGRMRRSVDPSYAAGCGQYLMCSRRAYGAAGGHEAIASSMHDGLLLPKAFRKAGIATDLVDATPLARCRMYRTGPEVWAGLSKNAAEGLAHPKRFAFFGPALLIGHIAPFALLPWASVLPGPLVGTCAAAAAVLLAVRADMARRFRQPWSMVPLHPVTVAALLALQATALVRHLLGAKPTWKGRGVAGADANQDTPPRPLLPVEPLLAMSVRDASSDTTSNTMSEPASGQRQASGQR